MKPITRLLLMLPGARQNGNSWSACCPAHYDRQSSLSITEGNDGRAHLDCHAGCTADAICSAVGLRAVEILSTADESNDDGGGRHAWHDAQALHPVAERVRLAPLALSPNAHANDLPAPCRAKACPASAAEVAQMPTPPAAAPNANDASARRHAVAVARTVRLSGVAPKPVRWLWPGRIALGKLTIISGDPGLGKSFLSCDLAARVSTGAEWPASGPGDGPNASPAFLAPSRQSPTAPRGSVVLLNCEDDLEDTIRPRLDRHGADVSRIIALEGVREPSNRNRERQFDLARDLAVLESAIRETGDCRLVVIDPVTAYLGDRHDSHKTADVRALLAPLAALAAKYETAVVAVSHLNKGNGAAIYRTTGSLAFVAAARAAWCVTRDRENPDRRLFLPLKNNLGNDATGLAYSIVDGRIRWEADPVTVSADDALTRQAERRKCSESAEAEAWLTTALAPGMSMPSKTILADARECGITEWRLREAARHLRVAIKKTGMNEGWMWTRFEDLGSAHPSA